eukprot:gene2083-19781_t
MRWAAAADAALLALSYIIGGAIMAATVFWVFGIAART